MSRAEPEVRPALSVVVPLYDEAENVTPLYAEIVAVVGGLDGAAELIFVDDGSRDATFERLREVRRRHSEGGGCPGLSLTVVRLRRNFGKASALAAGFAAARGEVVVTMDGDLQDDPREIPRLLARLDEGFHLVSGWKRTRRDPLTKTVPSRVFNLVVSLVTGIRIHDFNCGFKAYRRELVDELRLYGGLHRYVPVLAHAKGFRCGEVEVAHRPRRHGRTKYGAARFATGFLDLLTVLLLTGYASRPLHFFGVTGLLSLLGGVGLGLYLLVARLAGASPLGGGVAVGVAGALLAVVGVQLISLGLLGEMVVSRHSGAHHEAYSVAERLEA